MTHLQMKLSHDPLLKLLDRCTDQLTLLTADVKKLKDDSSKGSLSQSIQRLEVTQALNKNDVQQQLYKIKEFNEQLYLKQVEAAQKLDFELLKTRRQISEVTQGVDRQTAEAKRIENEVALVREGVRNLGEAVVGVVELEAVTSAMEQ